MPSRSTTHHHALAFTLIETLLVIFVVSLLVAIVAPSLASARARSRELVCISNMRGVSVITELYTHVYRDSFMFAGPDALFRLAPPPSDLAVATPGYWFLASFWPSLMMDQFSWRDNYVSWICAGGDRDRTTPWLLPRTSIPRHPSYRYVSGFYFRPELWDPAASSPVDINLLARPVRTFDVRFPSSKVMFIDLELAHLGRPPTSDQRPVCFPDGHATVEAISRATPPARNPITGSSVPFFDTPFGAFGRDY